MQLKLFAGLIRTEASQGDSIQGANWYSKKNNFKHRKTYLHQMIRKAACAPAKCQLRRSDSLLLAGHSPARPAPSWCNLPNPKKVKTAGRFWGRYLKGKIEIAAALLKFLLGTSPGSQWILLHLQAFIIIRNWYHKFPEARMEAGTAFLLLDVLFFYYNT